jgi:hypothetical protein
VNLVQNLGFDSRATHTKSNDQTWSIAAKELKFPIVHPSKVQSNEKFDHLESLFFFSNISLLKSVYVRFKIYLWRFQNYLGY